MFQQWRIIPHLAALYAMKIFSSNFLTILIEFNNKHLSGRNDDWIVDVGVEIHALSSAAKPLCSWLARDAIQDCRESCGGHGYLKSTYRKYYTHLCDVHVSYVYIHKNNFFNSIESTF